MTGAWGCFAREGAVSHLPKAPGKRERQNRTPPALLSLPVATGEPGHTFVLVDEGGKVVWLQDYGAEANGGRMYVPMEELVAAIQAARR